MNRILVVDDDPHIREVVQFALDKEGFDTLEAGDGAQALERFAANRPDLIVLDITMPELDGTEVCRRIRQTSRTPIIFLSSRDDEIDRVLPMNPSFVFFQETPGGPYGCLGQPVTEMRSVATDKDVFPRAGLMFIEVRLPDFAAHGGLVQRPERFFAFDQDRGGAIRSAGRCDIWMGLGEDAMERAGHVLSRGRMYYLFLKE